jgi:hypothetical protein
MRDRRGEKYDVIPDAEVSLAGPDGARTTARLEVLTTKYTDAMIRAKYAELPAGTRFFTDRKALVTRARRASGGGDAVWLGAPIETPGPRTEAADGRRRRAAWRPLPARPEGDGQLMFDIVAVAAPAPEPAARGAEEGAGRRGRPAKRRDGTAPRDRWPTHPLAPAMLSFVGIFGAVGTESLTWEFALRFGRSWAQGARIVRDLTAAGLLERRRVAAERGHASPSVYLLTPEGADAIGRSRDHDTERRTSLAMAMAQAQRVHVMQLRHRQGWEHAGAKRAGPLLREWGRTAFKVGGGHPAAVTEALAFDRRTDGLASPFPIFRRGSAAAGTLEARVILLVENGGGIRRSLTWIERLQPYLRLDFEVITTSADLRKRLDRHLKRACKRMRMPYTVTMARPFTEARSWWNADDETRRSLILPVQPWERWHRPVAYAPGAGTTPVERPGGAAGERASAAA